MHFLLIGMICTLLGYFSNLVLLWITDLISYACTSIAVSNYFT